jgi:hypothetical protein
MATTDSRVADAEASLTFSVELESDPVGFSLEVSADDRLPPAATSALLADARKRVLDEQGNLLFQGVRVGHGTLRSYGSRHDYDVEPVTESVEVTDVTSTDRSFSARVAWTHEAAQYFQFGVAPHTISGSPLLSFIWEDAPQGVREMFSGTERVDGDPRVYLPSVDHPGIPASRYVQATINWLRQEVA